MIRKDQQVSVKHGEASTVLTFVSATGQLVPPLIIHKGQWVQDMGLKAPGNIKRSTTKRSYITKSKFHEYSLNFVKFLKAYRLVDKTNLIIDGHKSHPFYIATRSMKPWGLIMSESLTSWNTTPIRSLKENDIYSLNWHWDQATQYMYLYI